jgi:hypothetical protein
MHDVRWSKASRSRYHRAAKDPASQQPRSTHTQDDALLWDKWGGLIPAPISRTGAEKKRHKHLNRYA